MYSFEKREDGVRRWGERETAALIDPGLGRKEGVNTGQSCEVPPPPFTAKWDGSLKFVFFQTEQVVHFRRVAEEQGEGTLGKRLSFWPLLPGSSSTRWSSRSCKYFQNHCTCSTWGAILRANLIQNKLHHTYWMDLCHKTFWFPAVIIKIYITGTKRHWQKLWTGWKHLARVYSVFRHSLSVYVWRFTNPFGVYSVCNNITYWQ